MKRILFLITIITLSACNKDTNDISTGTKISYRVDGSDYSHTGEQTISNGGQGVFAVKIKGIPGGINTLYSFAGNSGPGNQIQLLIIMDPADTLKTINYHLTQGNGSSIMINQQSISFIETDDYLDVSITSYENGVVNAVFSGKLSKIISLNPSVVEAANITNGQIKNAKINY